MKYETDRAILSWEEHGEGRPIVFLHGWTMNRQVEIDAYEPIFSARDGWLRIYPDLPGMGQSIGKAIRNQDDILAAMQAFLDHRLAGAPFVLAGTSLGGHLARAIAARRRDQVRGLLLRVPAIIADTAKRALPAFEPLVRDESVMAAIDPPSARRWVRCWSRRRPMSKSRATGSARWFSRRSTARRRGCTRCAAIPTRYGFSFDLAAAEKSFTKPALIDHGSPGHHASAIATPGTSSRAIRAPPSRWSIGRPTAGRPNRGDLLAALVDDWLERIEKAEQSI
jgi:pimeloyl-ACP methyl ester carboxylesterase